jgi:hypothetical protein
MAKSLAGDMAIQKDLGLQRRGSRARLAFFHSSSLKTPPAHHNKAFLTSRLHFFKVFSAH